MRHWILALLILTKAVAVADENAEQLILGQVRQAYQNLCSDCRFEFRHLRLPPLPKDWSKSLIVNTESVSWSGSFLLPMEAKGQNAGWVSGQVRIFKRGLVAKRGLSAGESLQKTDFDFDYIEVTHQKHQLATLEDLQRLAPKRFISIREPLTLNDLRKVMIVQRGQMIKVNFGDGNFEIATQMKSEEAGGIGDWIRVKNPDSNKIISVRIDKEGSARFE